VVVVVVARRTRGRGHPEEHRRYYRQQKTSVPKSLITRGVATKMNVRTTGLDQSRFDYLKQDQPLKTTTTNYLNKLLLQTTTANYHCQLPIAGHH
jgi:hypothetical protein